eukprot:COSAG05_NODE_46_length_25233_cov_40.235741_8_plen_71_part_00
MERDTVLFESLDDKKTTTKSKHFQVQDSKDGGGGGQSPTTSTRLHLLFLIRHSSNQGPVFIRVALVELEY